jgi:hypothetical protein
LLVPWTTLQPSSRARQWRRIGLGIALVSSTALLAAAAASASFNAGLALLAGVAGLATWAATRRRPGGQFEVGLSSLGEIEVRACDPAVSDVSAAAAVSVAFASPWLISLRCGTMLIPIWPDSLPQSTYRQLWVHLRWGRAMPIDDVRRTIPTNRANSMDR